MAGADRMTIEEVVRKVLLDEHADVIREAVKAVAAEMMELEVSELIGAGRGERRPEDRATHRNGYRGRRWDTRAGELELQIPKPRQGSYFPSFLEPRKRSEQALLAVVQQAYVCGVSTRRVDQLVERLGLRISKSDVSRVCAALDEHVEAFRTRPLEGRYPYLFLDAKIEKVRDGGRVVAKALVVAHGVHETGRREILSIDVGEAETEAFWTDFLRGLVKRGLTGVQLAISDAHAGLKAAIAKVLGCGWQRCTVHFLRDCLGHARKDQHGLLAAVIRPIFNADSLEQARDRLSEAVAHLDGRMPKVVALLEDAEADILAFYAFPAPHWPKLRSTNPLERFNKEIGRRMKGGVSPEVLTTPAMDDTQSSASPWTSRPRSTRSECVRRPHTGAQAYERDQYQGGAAGPRPLHAWRSWTTCPHAAKAESAATALHESNGHQCPIRAEISGNP